MAVFNSYVSLPEGIQDIDIDNDTWYGYWYWYMDNHDSVKYPRYWFFDIDNIDNIIIG